MNAKFSPVEYLLRNAETPKKSSQLGISNLSFYVSTWFSTMFLKKTEFFAHFRALVVDFLFSRLFTFFFSFFSSCYWWRRCWPVMCHTMCDVCSLPHEKERWRFVYCKWFRYIQNYIIMNNLLIINNFFRFVCPGWTKTIPYSQRIC